MRKIHITESQKRHLMEVLTTGASSVSTDSASNTSSSTNSNSPKVTPNAGTDNKVSQSELNQSLSLARKIGTNVEISAKQLGNTSFNKPLNDTPVDTKEVKGNLNAQDFQQMKDNAMKSGTTTIIKPMQENYKSFTKKQLKEARVRKMMNESVSFTKKDFRKKSNEKNIHN